MNLLHVAVHPGNLVANVFDIAHGVVPRDRPVHVALSGTIVSIDGSKEAILTYQEVSAGAPKTVVAFD